MEKITAIKQIRLKLGLTQVQVSSMLGITQSHYSANESGKVKRLSKRYLAMLAKYLSASPEYLLYGIGDMFIRDRPLYSQRI